MCDKEVKNMSRRKFEYEDEEEEEEWDLEEEEEEEDDEWQINEQRNNFFRQIYTLACEC